MLPFLKKLKESSNSGVIVQKRQSDAPKDENDPSAAIEACASALITAIHAHDIKGVSDALCDAFEILESTPHKENKEKTNDYDSLNEMAADRY